jgi:hypothetical protein
LIEVTIANYRTTRVEVRLDSWDWGLSLPTLAHSTGRLVRQSHWLTATTATPRAPRRAHLSELLVRAAAGADGDGKRRVSRRSLIGTQRVRNVKLSDAHTGQR